MAKKVKIDTSSVDVVLKELRKKYGDDSIMKLGEKKHINVESISTGSIILDQSLGIGGLPKGRIVEVYGPESSGKTTIALQTIASVQKNGGTAAFIDVEHALDPKYAKQLGVDVDELIISQPDSGEEALDITESLIKTGEIDVIVVDSVAALVPRAEIEGNMGDAHVGLQARLMSQALRKITASISKTKTVAIFINQLREKVGIMFGNPETTPGGRALKFYSSVRLDVRKSSPIKKGENIIGNEVKIKVVKNKVAAPFKVAEVEIMYGQGISKISELIDLGVQYDFIKKSGSWYSLEEQKIGQGKENVKAFFEENLEKLDILEKQILDIINKED